jgi:hypothetical protein
MNLEVQDHQQTELERLEAEAYPVKMTRLIHKGEAKKMINDLNSALKSGKREVLFTFEGECLGGNPEYAGKVIKKIRQLRSKGITVHGVKYPGSHVASCAEDVFLQCSVNPHHESGTTQAHGSESRDRQHGPLDSIRGKIGEFFSSISRSWQVTKEKGIGKGISYFRDLMTNKVRSGPEAHQKKDPISRTVGAVRSLIGRLWN